MATLAEDLINSVLGSTATSAAISEVKSSLSSSVSSAINSASDYVTDQVSSLFSDDDTSNSATASITDSASMFGTTSTTGDLNKTVSGSANGSLEVSSKISSIGADSSEAIASPVSFKTKSVVDTISASITSQTTSATAIPVISDIIANVESSGKYIINTVDDWDAAVIDINNSLVAISDNASSLLSSVSSIIPTELPIPDLGEILPTSYIDATDIDFSSGVLESLGSSVSGFISDNVSALASSVTNDLIASKVTNLSSILSTVGNSISAETITSTLLGFGASSSTYSTITDLAGNTLAGFDKITDINSISSLYDISKLFCSDITMPDILNLQYLKDLFDTLVSYLSLNGLLDLLEQLFECGTSTTTSGTVSLVDSRTTSILTSSLTSLAAEGAAVAYSSVLDLVGTSNVASSTNELITLNSNMTATGENTAAYGKITDSFHTDTFSLVTTNYNDQTVYSGQNVSVMSATNTSVIDSAIGTEDRTLIQGSMLAYA